MSITSPEWDGISPRRPRSSPRESATRTRLVVGRPDVRAAALGTAAALLAVGATGCLSASLATDTGPRPPGFQWSDADRQLIHVGEDVAFDFVLQDSSRNLVSPAGVADYCAATIGDRRVEADPDAHGHFEFRHRFDDVRPGDVIDVRAAAYRQNGSRDFVRVGAQWFSTDSPYSIPDKKVAEDTVRLTVYQTIIELRLARPPDDLELDTGVLRIRRADGSSTAVYIDRPGRPGFVARGPDENGVYLLTYAPSAGELNKTGTTEAEWTVYDLSGRKHSVGAVLDTP